MDLGSLGCRLWSLVGPLALGGTIGILTGLSRNDSTVLAAVLPAMLAAAGGVVFVVPRLWKALRDEDKSEDGSPSRVAVLGDASSIVAVFSLALLGGAIWGHDYMLGRDEAVAKRLIAEHSETIEAEAEAEATRRDKQFEHIERCSIWQFQLNRERGQLGLESVTIRQVCPDLPARSSENAGAVFVPDPDR